MKFNKILLSNLLITFASAQYPYYQQKADNQYFLDPEQTEFSSTEASSTPVSSSVEASSSTITNLTVSSSKIITYIYPLNNRTLTKFTTETEVVTAFTTYCPEPTTIITNGKTITVYEPTTITITDCPCTLTKTVPIHITTELEDNTTTTYRTFWPTNNSTGTTNTLSIRSILEYPKPSTTSSFEDTTTNRITYTISTEVTTSSKITHTKSTEATVPVSSTTESGVTKPTVEIAPNDAIELTPSFLGMAIAAIMLL